MNSATSYAEQPSVNDVLARKSVNDVLALNKYLLDTVNKKLLAMVDEGNSGSVYFYLKCKGKSRGFVESAQQQHMPIQPITFNYKLVMPNATVTLPQPSMRTNPQPVIDFVPTQLPDVSNNQSEL